MQTIDSGWGYVSVASSIFCGAQKMIFQNLLLWTSHWEHMGSSKHREGLSLRFPCLPKNQIHPRGTQLPSNTLPEISLSKEDLTHITQEKTEHQAITPTAQRNTVPDHCLFSRLISPLNSLPPLKLLTAPHFPFSSENSI